MKHIKKKILLIHPKEIHGIDSSKEKSPPSLPQAKAEMTVISHDICFDYIQIPPAPPKKNMGMPTKPSPPLNCTDSSTLPRNIASFISNVIQKIDAVRADALLFDMPFQNDEILFQVLETINWERDITMGITRVVMREQKKFELPENFFTLSNLRLIQWHIPQPEDGLDTRPLWQISREGIWNHFILGTGKKAPKGNAFFSFVFSNPNIAHSHEMAVKPLAEKKANISYDMSFLPMEMPYRSVEQLPGIPLWQALNSPAHVLLYLSRYSRKELFPMRVNMVTGAVFSLGRDITFYFEKSENLPPGYLDEICNMVEAGGSVATKWVRYNLERAFLIAYAMENGVIVGNSSLKRPRKLFIERINKISGMNFTHFLERGYTSVRPEYRALGVGAKLLEGLTARAEDHKIFSIISEDNTATQKIAIRNKTRKVVTYYSEQMGKSAGIWMPESMIDT
ncbi:MAG: hypothetical protein QM498_12720 [Desulfobacterium sp.]